MKKIVIAVLLAVVLCPLLTGCGPGVVDSQLERETRYRDITELEKRMFVDDWDYFILMERSTRLSEWKTAVGF